MAVQGDGFPGGECLCRPGGYVFITRGLLAAANDEAELAGVLAHRDRTCDGPAFCPQLPVSHWLANFGVQLGTALAAATVMCSVRCSKSAPVCFSSNTAVTMSVRPMPLAWNMLLRPATTATAWPTSLPPAASGNAAGPAWGRSAGGFSTHPSPVDREAACAARRLSGEAVCPAKLPRQPRCLSRQGRRLTLRDDPRQGFREGEWFYLPRYQVQFRSRTVGIRT